jgi:hypothetical protein
MIASSIFSFAWWIRIFSRRQLIPLASKQLFIAAGTWLKANYIFSAVHFDVTGVWI